MLLIALMVVLMIPAIHQVEFKQEAIVGDMIIRGPVGRIGQRHRGMSENIGRRNIRERIGESLGRGRRRILEVINHRQRRTGRRANTGSSEASASRRSIRIARRRRRHEVAEMVVGIIPLTNRRRARERSFNKRLKRGEIPTMVLGKAGPDAFLVLLEEIGKATAGVIAG